MPLIARRAALRGLVGAAPRVLGLEIGLYCWALAAGAGFAALVAASEAWGRCEKSIGRDGDREPARATGGSAPVSRYR